MLLPKNPLRTALLSITLGLIPMHTAQSFDFFSDFLNPSKWLGGGKYEDDWYDYGPGPYGPPPGVAPYGVPYAPPPGYGIPYGYGYGTPYYYPGPPGFRGTPPSVSEESSRSYNVKSAEIEALKRRIEELEAQQRRSSYTPPPEPWTSPKDRWAEDSAARTWDSSPQAWNRSQKAAEAQAAPSWDTQTNTDSSTWTTDPSSWGAAPVFRPLDKY